jgi:hypothetical protein
MRVVMKAPALLLIGLFFGGQAAWGQSDEKAKLVDAAKKEGKVVW